MKTQVWRLFYRQHTEDKQHIILLVDASHSMLTIGQLAKIKGLLLENIATLKPNQYFALVVMEQSTANIRLDFTDDFANIRQAIARIKSSGKTNLKAGFVSVAQLIKKQSEPAQTALYIFSDGRANIGGDAPLQDAIVYFKKHLNGLQTNVIDTETDFVKLGRAKMLAVGIGGDYGTVAL